MQSQGSEAEDGRPHSRGGTIWLGFAMGAVAIGITVRDTLLATRERTH